jgi:hypothetical protein
MVLDYPIGQKDPSEEQEINQNIQVCVSIGF